MRKEGLLLAVILLGAIGFVQAQGPAEVQMPAQAPAMEELHGTVGVIYDTRYVWRGFTPFGSQTAIHPFIDLDLMGTGFGIDVMAHRANASGYENGERWDYALYYKNTLGEDTCVTDYKLSYVYYNFPDNSSHTATSVDLQEINAMLSWPNLLGVEGLVPGYSFIKMWPRNSKSAVGNANSMGGTASGFIHVFSLDYAVPVAGLTAEVPEQILNFHTELVYNDGVDPRANGGYEDTDWTNVVFGVSTDFDLGSGVTLTPALNYQITMEDDETKGVNSDADIVWAGLTVKCKF